MKSRTNQIPKLPSNIEEYINRPTRSYIKPDVKKVQRWCVAATGSGVIGGTAIGKDHNTLLLDIKYQDCAIRIGYDGEIYLYDEVVKSPKRFKEVYLKHNSK